MTHRFASTSLLAITLLWSCSKPAPTAGMHATVTMRDGKTLAGTVLSSSASEIQLSGDDHVTQTIPLAQVSSISYDSAPATTAASPATMNAPAPVASNESAPQSMPPPSAPPQTTSAKSSNPLPYNPPSQPAPTPPQELHENHYHPQEAAITTKTFILAAGTRISVRNEETIDSKKAVEGQTFAAEVTSEVDDAEGAVVIPRGANAQIVIRSASKGGRFKGTADLVMDLSSISIDGREYSVSTVDLSEKARAGVGANKRTGEFAGGGAVFGAIVGAIAGGGKGAAIGAGSGAGAGALTQVLTRGSIKVPAETILTFKLDESLHVKAAQ